LLSTALGQFGFDAIIAATIAEARELAAKRVPDAALLDVLMPDGDGVRLALELQATHPRLRIVIMTGMGLAPEETAICTRHEFPILRKPFLAVDAAGLLEARLSREGSRSAQAPR
jgi:DNA-binding NtrC family response regulator